MDIFNRQICRLNTSSQKWKSADEHQLSFSIADSDYQTAPEIIAAIKERCDHGIFGYTFIDDEYLEILVNWVNRRYHYQIKKNWIIPCLGVIPSMAFSIEALTDPGDKIVVQSPVYDPFYAVVTKTNRTLVISKLLRAENRYVMDFDDLEKCFQNGAKMMILCNPHNPVGRVWDQAELDRLVALCKQYQVILISDEIHCDFILAPKPFVSIGRYIPEYDRLLICTAPSKTFNLAGLQNSNIFIPNPLFRAAYAKESARCFIQTPNVLALTACKAAYSLGEPWLEAQLKHLRKNYAFVREFLEKELPMVKIADLEGTYLVWADLRFLNLTCQEISDGLLEQGMIIKAGETYGEGCNGFIRLNIACGREQLKAGMNMLKNFVVSHINK